MLFIFCMNLAAVISKSFFLMNSAAVVSRSSLQCNQALSQHSWSNIVTVMLWIKSLQRKLSRRRSDGTLTWNSGAGIPVRWPLWSFDENRDWKSATLPYCWLTFTSWSTGVPSSGVQTFYIRFPDVILLTSDMVAVVACVRDNWFKSVSFTVLNSICWYISWLAAIDLCVKQKVS